MARRRGRRGIVGIEAAIVMIAFVIVAAALAFVALNMGMTATQKTKEAIGASMGEAGSALMVDGDVMAYYDGTAVSYEVIPIRPASGKYPIDLNSSRTSISLLVGDTYYADIYDKAANGGSAVCIPNPATTDVSALLVGNGTKVFNSTNAAAVIVFTTGDGDCVLEYGEKALILVQLNPTANVYDTIKVEIKPPEGSPLLVERTIPPSLPGAAGLFSLS